MKENYDDIINLEHHEPIKHPRMSMESRAAQFAPFAALTGYEAAVSETARLTTDRIEIDEEMKSILDAKIQIIQSQIENKPLITITYFVPDERKAGGKYVDVSGRVIKIDEYMQQIILDDNIEVPIREIIEIVGDSISLSN